MVMTNFSLYIGSGFLFGSHQLRCDQLLTGLFQMPTADGRVFVEKGIPTRYANKTHQLAQPAGGLFKKPSGNLGFEQDSLALKRGSAASMARRAS